MSELDVETLKLRIKNAADESRPWDQTLLTLREWQWVHAALEDGKLHRYLLDKALEDRERLRAIAQVLVDNLGEAAKRDPDLLLQLWQAFIARNVLIAALEGRPDG